jgi:hypothetical protein
MTKSSDDNAWRKMSSRRTQMEYERKARLVVEESIICAN